MKTLKRIPLCAMQSQQKEIVFYHLTIEDGLSHNSVFHVIHDRQGFIWAATVQGINKYDGMRFIPFTRLDQARTRGHGLGLAIVRRIVESRGVPVQGSVFFFTLPAVYA